MDKNKKKFCECTKDASNNVKWVKKTLTYSVTNLTGPFQPWMIKHIDDAFRHTAETCGLKFVKVAYAADLRISWGEFDGDGGKLGRAFYPDPESVNAGVIQLDKGERWTPQFFKSVLLHEIGHALGLTHSTFTSRSYVSSRVTKPSHRVAVR